MAAQNWQKFTESSLEIMLEIKLNELFVGKRRLRFIYLYLSNIVSTNLVENKTRVPLFLGCDVVSECGLSCGNLPRFHAKHAKKGLATKVKFEAGFRIVGIHGTTQGVWFYSIQGLFKIAFEYYQREEQHDCLLKLQEVWKRQIFDAVLTPQVQVTFKSNIEEINPSNELTPQPEAAMSTSVSDVDRFVCHVMKTVDDFVWENNKSFKSEVELLKAYLSCMTLDMNSDSYINRTMKLVNNCVKLLSETAESLPSHPSHPDADGFSESTVSQDDFSSTSKKASELQNENSTDNQKISCEADDQGFWNWEGVTLAVAQWLGCEFWNYHSVINEKVTAFKQRNMSRIGNLPSAEELIKEVFPKTMLVFLCSWMQVPLTTGEGCTESTENRSSLFPVIQLVLELANQNLVSGVAHVLFSQLVQSDSVQ